MSRRVCIGVAIAVLLVVANAAADPPPAESPAPLTTQPSKTSWLHLRTPSHVVTDGGADLRLPAGWFLDEPTWTAREDVLKDLQDDKTRRDAENKSFRASAASWQPGWVTVTLVFVAGVAGGVYVTEKWVNR